MKICSLSDIHGNLQLNIPKCDVLCICGDIVGLNDQRNMDKSSHWWYNRFTKWVNSLPCEKVIIVPGNHDFFIELMYNEGSIDIIKEDLAMLTKDKLILLLDDEYTYKGKKFYGNPWIEPIDFQEDRWAFSNKGTSEEKLKRYSNIPKTCDILLTHDSPFYNNRLNEFAEFIKYDSNKYHFFGHWHDGMSCPEEGRYNCSILNDMYRIKTVKPIEIEIMTKQEIQEVKQHTLDIIITLLEKAIADTDGEITNLGMIDILKEFKEQVSDEDITEDNSDIEDETSEIVDLQETNVDLNE